MFPFKTQEQHYLIADASQGQALIAVYHFGNLTNLYLSDETGQLYSLSIQNLKVTLPYWELYTRIARVCVPLGKEL